MKRTIALLLTMAFFTLSLAACAQKKPLHTVTDLFKPCGSATTKPTGSRSTEVENQGVASNRVYSEPMLP